MSPDDPRHGTHRGYVIGCRGQCCTVAHARYMNLYRMGQTPRMVDPTGTVRRIQALQAIGWNCRDIGTRCDKGDEWARLVARSKRVTTTTAFAVAQVYDELCMTVPEGVYAERTRRQAREKGYAPPLAWDDIDDPSEVPNLGGRDHEIDPVVVDRLLSGRRIPSTQAEKLEAMRRWLAQGRSEKSLCDAHGWKYGRYVTREAGAA